MPKTKDAFAFKDFDETRILSRKFFDMYFADCRMSQKGILDIDALQNYRIQEYSNIAGLYSTLLRSIWRRASRYLALIQRHVGRISAYNNKLAKMTLELSERVEQVKENELQNLKFSIKKLTDRLKRIVIIQNRYTEIMKSIENLVVAICKISDENNEFLERYFREGFASRLKRERKKVGLTQQQLADTVGINRVELAKFESGRNVPSFFTLNKIIRYNGFSADSLLVN